MLAILFVVLNPFVEMHKAKNATIALVALFERTNRSKVCVSSNEWVEQKRREDDYPWENPY